MPSFGVNIESDEMAEWIEDQRIRTESGGREIVSRSQVIRECVVLARIAVEEIEAAPFDVEREQWRHVVRQALVDWRQREERRE